MGGPGSGPKKGASRQRQKDISQLRKDKKLATEVQTGTGFGGFIMRGQFVGGEKEKRKFAKSVVKKVSQGRAKVGVSGKGKAVTTKHRM